MERKRRGRAFRLSFSYKSITALHGQNISFISHRRESLLFIITLNFVISIAILFRVANDHVQCEDKRSLSQPKLTGKVKVQ